MSQHQASVIWERATGAPFVDNRYSRAHRWEFDGGATVSASSSPSVVPVPLSDDPAPEDELRERGGEVRLVDTDERVIGDGE